MDSAKLIAVKEVELDVGTAEKAQSVSIFIITKLPFHLLTPFLLILIFLSRDAQNYYDVVD